MKQFNTHEIRQLVAEEAARLIYDEGYRDYKLAKLKASQRLGTPQKSHLQPSNEEVQDALKAYIQLYEAEAQAEILEKHRRIALEAMEFLQDFEPKLTGAVANETSGPLSTITIHLRPDTPESILFFLDEHRIPFQEQEKRISFGRDVMDCPVFQLYADDVEVELVALPNNSHFNQPPISPVTGKKANYLTIEQLQTLLPLS